MKYFRKTLVIITAAALSFASTSCKKDKENPTITVMTPAQHTHFNWGDEVHIEANFADDQGLKNYAVVMADADGNQLADFDFMKAGTAAELTYEFHEHFMVPDSAPMMAWLQFSVWDNEDKKTTMDWMLHFDE